MEEFFDDDFEEDSEESLMHYGTKRHSGRYKYGSGENPYQHEAWFVWNYNTIKKNNFGISDDDIRKAMGYTGNGGKAKFNREKERAFDNIKDIADVIMQKEGYTRDSEVARALGMSSGDLRALKGIAKAKQNEDLMRRNLQLVEHGYSSRNKRAEMLGIPESTLRNMEKDGYMERNSKAYNIAEEMKKYIKDDKSYYDVGKGINYSLNVSEHTMQEALTILKNQGYGVHNIQVPQATNPDQKTTVSVLGPQGASWADTMKNQNNISTFDMYFNDDGKTRRGIYEPKSIDSSRIKIHYGDEKFQGTLGTDMDGVIQLRRGVGDISLGKASYAQVRIMVDGTHYLKGMAIYSDDMPAGTDIIFNTNKPSGTPAAKVFKSLKTVDIKDANGNVVRTEIDKDNPFGANIKAGGQNFYKNKNGEYVQTSIDNFEKATASNIKKSIDGERYSLSAANIIKEEGDWNHYQKKLASQFLSKQPMELINKQLNLTYADKNAEFEEIKSLTNPTIKRKLLGDFAEACDKAAVDLKVAALPGQTAKVILPVTDLKEGECYCPTYKDGTYLALVRYPHAGTFEIPIVKVNNKNKQGQSIVGPNAQDAIGISAKDAEQLSGADFDGDTVVCLPTTRKPTANGIYIASRKPFESLKNFSTNEYAISDERFKATGEYILGKNPLKTDTEKVANLKNKIANGYKPTEADFIEVGKEKLVMTEDAKQKQMGVVSNLITDMTLKGASPDELARATKASMVVIDAVKHELDYKQAYEDCRIPELKKIYQKEYNEETGETTGGASTLISRSKSEVRIKERKEGSSDYIDPKTGEKGKSRMYYDPNTGKRIYTETGRTYTDKNGNEVEALQKVTRMAYADDAMDLVSQMGTQQEKAYARYANALKEMARESRKELYKTDRAVYDKNAKEKYAIQVERLQSKLELAVANSPRERQAQIDANKTIKEAIQRDPSLKDDKEHNARLRQQAIAASRDKYGAKGKDTRIKIEDDEWEAIQAGAISDSKLEEILKYCDLDVLRERAMPKTQKTLSNAQAARIKAMKNSGFTIAEIAEQMSLSTSTVSKYIKEAA